MSAAEIRQVRLAAPPPHPAARKGSGHTHPGSDWLQPWPAAAPKGDSNSEDPSLLALLKWLLETDFSFWNSAEPYLMLEGSRYRGHNPCYIPSSI